MTSLKTLAGLGLVSLLAACGGSTSGDDDYLGSTTDKNVALASNGATASANYNSVQAPKVIDGNTTTAEYWSGNVQNDYVTVDFGRIRNLKEISIYTSDTSISSSNPTKLIELSSDNATWRSTAELTGGDISCSTFQVNADRVRCVFGSREQARYFRFTVKASGSNAALMNVYEMQAIGY